MNTKQTGNGVPRIGDWIAGMWRDSVKFELTFEEEKKASRDRHNHPNGDDPAL